MLYKYTITEERFDEAKSQLLLAGFTENDAKKLIIRKSSANSVSSVLNYCDKLLQPPFNLTKKQIIKIAANAGGGKNILTFFNAFQDLKSNSLNTEQIVRIAGNSGGSKAIQTVLHSFKELNDIGFNTEQIVRITGNIGGSKTIQAVLHSFEELKDIGFNTEQIARIAGNIGGSKAIQTLLTSSPFLGLRGR